ncbi:SMC family ATPase [Microbacterium sp. 4R-513]|uniref:AAA family ATPase n=1 Tax=Microbacterium sp. 4R-513 TaxID=2567934 RepID=UPI0013E15868|nr:SMC family ATPase [Microbacterium sp. 4R-513]QIG39699.1 SMC family ATPase [Microbacterium sp. 4R-513]
MRLHRLELEGFGPFRARQVVDFDSFADDGIFLIGGRTGAGKSSVLDGVCFALYGGVPRYDGSERRLRSDYCTPEDATEVAVEFSAAGRRWRVVRSPEYERAKKRGTGTTTVAADATLFEWNGTAWEGRAAGLRNVGLELDQVLGLTQQQFLQVILLAQNRFAEFLLAKSDERQKLLRKLFGTRTYEEYQSALEQRRKAAEQSLAAAGDGVALLLGEAERVLTTAALAGEEPAPTDLAGRIEFAALGAQRAAYRAETLMRDRDAADAAHRSADIAHTAAKERRAAQERRERSRSALAALEEQAPLIAADRETLERAVAAEALRAPIEAVERARDRVVAAEGLLAHARRAWEAIGFADHAAPGGADAAPDASGLLRLIDDLTGELARLQAVAEQERELEAAEQRLEADRARAEEFTTDLAALDAGRAAIPAAIERLEAQLADARESAGALEATKAQLDSVETRLAAARDAARLATVLADAEEAYLSASARLDRARAHVTALLQRRVAGRAGELAAELVDGEPCVVCGSLEHPHPAASSDDVATDDEIGHAERTRDVAAAAESEAAEAARVAREAHAGAAARAGGDSVEVLQDAHITAKAAHASAREAVDRRDRLTIQRQDLLDADAAVAEERTRLAAELEAVRIAIAGAEADVRTARRAVAKARGDHASVAERISALTIRRDAARRLADALASTAVDVAALGEAEADCDARVAASDFPDAAAAAQALRDPATRALLDTRIREHESALRSEKDRLRELELELAGVPDELVDLDATATALALARDRWSAAVDAAALAEQVASNLAGLVERARTRQESLAGLADEAAVVTRLADTVAGRAPNTHRMTLESFVLAAELEEIVGAANLRLSDMSAGRYVLQHTDARAARNAASGLGLEIMDAHTGQARPAQSLSGGETFLASLALALGLAEVVTARAGGVRLDTLFIDEGFGSLDADTLELAMRTLDELRQGGRTVGVISHVEAMKEQLPAQLVVEATPRGPSVVRVSGEPVGLPFS